jgi:hypothetical protein
LPLSLSLSLTPSRTLSLSHKVGRIIKGVDFYSIAGGF